MSRYNAIDADSYLTRNMKNNSTRSGCQYRKAFAVQERVTLWGSLSEISISADVASSWSSPFTDSRDPQCPWMGHPAASGRYLLSLRAPLRRPALVLHPHLPPAVRLPARCRRVRYRPETLASCSPWYGLHGAWQPRLRRFFRRHRSGELSARPLLPRMWRG